MLAKGSLTLRGWSPEKPAGQMALLEPAGRPHKPFSPGTQLYRVHRAMMGGGWATLTVIAGRADIPTSTIGSRIRDLRKLLGHEHTIHVKEHPMSKRLHLYRMEEKNG